MDDSSVVHHNDGDDGDGDDVQAFDAIVVTKVIGHPGSFLFKEVRLLQLFGPSIIITIIAIIAITTIVVIITITTTRKNSGLSYYLNCTLRIR